MSIVGLAVRRAPARLYDAYVLDLDGTIYLGDQPPERRPTMVLPRIDHLLNDSEEP